MADDLNSSQYPQLPPEPVAESWLARNRRFVILGGTVVVLVGIVALAPLLQSNRSTPTSNTATPVVVGNQTTPGKKTNPTFRRYSVTTIADQDLDGLPDADEEKIGTNPAQADTDGDGLSDYDEVKIYHTNPLNPDTDNDGASDGLEVRRGTNPNGSGTLFDVNQAIHQSPTK